MKFLISAIIILCVSNSFPQTINVNVPRESEVFLLPQGFGIELLNSKGSSGIINDVSNISAMNPAAIQKLKSLSFGFSYQFQTTIDEAYIFDVGTSRIQNYLPQSFGGIIHYNEISFGVGFGQKYNGSLDFDPLPITTVNYPDGTGEYYYPKFENSLQTYTFSTAYRLNGIITESSNLSIGLTYILNRLYSYESIGNVSANASAFGSNFMIGACYEMKTDEEQILNIGISYTSGTNISDEVKYESNGSIIPGSIPGDSTHFYIVAEPYTLFYSVPSELGFDIYYRLNSNIELLGRINNIFRNSNSNNVKDQLEFSAIAAYLFNSSTLASLGLYYTSKKYIEDVFDMNDELYAVFITAGLSFQINFLKVDLALADSHLFSGDLWKQTIGKIGLGIQL